MRLFLLPFFFCSFVFADVLTEIKTAVAELPGHEPIKARLRLEITKSEGEKESRVVEEPVVAQAIVSDGSQGLCITWPGEILVKAADETKIRQKDPDKKTPFRAAVDSLSAIEVYEYLNATPVLLRRLENAQLEQETQVEWQGKKARLLSFKLFPLLSEKDKKYIKQMEASAKVWLDVSNNLPLAAQTRIYVKGRALLVISFESEEKEDFVFARFADRLVTVEHIKESHGSGAGEKGESRVKTSLSLLPCTRAD
jgi:hypothetical protein